MLQHLGVFYRAQGQYEEATGYYKAALEMNHRLTTQFAQEMNEGQSLTLVATTPLTRDGFLSNELIRGATPDSVYPSVWLSKGAVARVYERRQLQARAAAANPKAAMLLTQLAEARRRRAELLLAPATTDPATLAQTQRDIKAFEERIDGLTKALKPLLPNLERADKLANADLSEVQKAMPPGTALVDYLRFVLFDHDKRKLEAGQLVRRVCCDKG
jgi:tetratricopeptide (TPR) repeat protein